METKLIDVEMTSLEIAELTGKKHFHVMRDIRDKLLPVLKDESSFGCMSKYAVKTATYKDAYGRDKDMFILGVNAARAFCANYKITEALKLVKRIDELEAELKVANENLELMKNVVWEVINGENYVGQRWALKSAGIKHPNKFMEFLRGKEKYFARITSPSRPDQFYLRQMQCSPNPKNNYWKFTKLGFQWLLENRDKMNQWVDEKWESQKKENKLLKEMI